MAKQDRPKIPADIKREVRRRCGFGCVICGLPIYEYDHLLGWAEVERHVAEEITLLCDRHHREKTSGLLPNESVIAADKNPHNLQAGQSTGYPLHFGGATAEIVLGTCQTTMAAPFDFLAVMIDDRPLLGFRFEEGNFLLFVRLYDEFNNLVLEVLDNELTFSVDPWDIEFVGATLTIRNAPRSIFVSLIFEPPNVVKVSRGKFLANGVEFEVWPDRAELKNFPVEFSSVHTSGFQIMYALGDTPKEVSAAFRIVNLPRYEWTGKGASAS